ncbi:MAG: recombinase family protein [Phycisphaeraceae bacterium]|nr:recombinase family protein [Phycisphaeraceae bacterium]
MSKPMRDVRCAIYTRKSHEEGLDQEFNSLDAQRLSAEAYIESQRHEGWKLIRKRYDDAAYSGGTLDRPALKSLLDDIQAGHIDCVVVYKVDRLSRSLLDFAKLISLFDEHSVSFVSVTQQFNTTTSMGRLTLNILLSFAQFEREIIGERIRDKKLATARQGKYGGSGPILGLDVVDRKYVVNREEARLVRDIFDRFEKLESCRKVAVALNAEGLRTKRRKTTRSGKLRGDRPWTQRSVYEVLINRRYMGQIVHKGKAYPGEHEAIVPSEQFERVQVQLSANKTYTHKHQVKHFVLLRRMIRCGHCGSRVQPTWTRKNASRQYRYYACTRRVKEGYGQCPLPNLPAGQIETAVVDQLRALLRHPDVIARTYREISKSGTTGPDPATLARLDELRRRREQTQKSIRAVLNVADQDDGFMADELKRLNGELRSLDKSSRDLEAQAARGAPVDLDRVGEALRAIDPIWDVLIPEEQRRIAQLLIEEITVSTSGIDIRFRTNGIEQIVEELQPTPGRPGNPGSPGIEERAHA